MSVEIVFETHSISTDNERGIATGWLPGLLSERGRTLAAELGERRRDDGIAAVFTSDLRRAVETAEIAFGGAGIPIHQDPRLRECNYGSLNGVPSRRWKPSVRGGSTIRSLAERATGRRPNACAISWTICGLPTTASESS